MRQVSYYYLEPEAAGCIGPGTVIDSSVHPPIVHRLHYILDAWLGDDIVERFPVYLVSDRLRGKLEEAGLTGFDFAPVEVTEHEDFRLLYRGRRAPVFCWLQLHGVAGSDDFARGPDHRLVVSHRALEVLQALQLDFCVVAPFP